MPNYQHLHGSAYNELEVYTHEDEDKVKNSFFRQEMEITRTKWKSLDKDSERCSQGHRKNDTEKCITRYFQRGYSDERNDILVIFISGI